MPDHKINKTLIPISRNVIDVTWKAENIQQADP